MKFSAAIILSVLAVASATTVPSSEEPQVEERMLVKRNPFAVAALGGAVGSVVLAAANEAVKGIHSIGDWNKVSDAVAFRL